MFFLILAPWKQYYLLSRVASLCRTEDENCRNISRSYGLTHGRLHAAIIRNRITAANAVAVAIM